MNINYLTQSDTEPVVFQNFVDDDGDAITTNLVASVAFTLKNKATGTIAVNQAACTITSTGSTALVCQWAPGANDLATAGTYDAELVITYTSTKVKRYPAKAGSFVFVVRAKTA